MLSLKDVEAGYGPPSVLKGVSLEVRAGEIVVLLGANGAGKTTTLMAISGLIRARRGAVRFEDRRIDASAPADIVRQGISHVPEGRRVLPRLTILENLQLGAYLRADRAGVQQDLARAFELFPILAQRRSQLAGTLSGGEQQMLAIARGLMARPKLLLLDEPSLGLAPKLVTAIFEIITRINREGVTLLLVEQNAYLSLQIAHRGYVMEAGRIVLADTAAALANSPHIKAAYLGG